MWSHLKKDIVIASLAQRTSTNSLKNGVMFSGMGPQNADMFTATPHSHIQDHLKNSTASLEGCGRFI